MKPPQKENSENNGAYLIQSQRRKTQGKTETEIILQTKILEFQIQLLFIRQDLWVKQSVQYNYLPPLVDCLKYASALIQAASYIINLSMEGAVF